MKPSDIAAAGGELRNATAAGENTGEEAPYLAGIVVGPSKPLKRELAKKMRREMTDAEVRLWQYLRKNRLSGLHFRRQQVVDGFIVDFFCHAAALVIEVDGPVHEAREEYDAARDELLRLRGLRLIRFTNRQVDEDISSVLREIHRAAAHSIPGLPPFDPVVSPSRNRDRPAEDAGWRAAPPVE